MIFLHFLQCAPDKRVKPVNRCGKIHQPICQGIPVFIMLQLMKQDMTHSGRLAVTDKPTGLLRRRLFLLALLPPAGLMILHCQSSQKKDSGEDADKKID